MISIEEARQYYSDHDPAHGFDHVLRVWRLAQRIGQKEGANMEILQAAVLLHDIARVHQGSRHTCHAQLGAQMARKILAGHPPELVERVAEAIAQHRFRGKQKPSSLEAQILYDADKLDAIGAIGIARAYAIAGARRQKLWAPVPSSYINRPPHEGKGDLESAEHTPIHEYLFKLAKLKNTLYTETAKQIAEERDRFMRGFFERLDREVAGEL
ncbi:MAG: HD domain-containing protein [Anaerolineae bacterium]|nr:HD domain-containing protein [Anaerolineae bacterium]